MQTDSVHLDILSFELPQLQANPESQAGPMSASINKQPEIHMASRNEYDGDVSDSSAELEGRRGGKRRERVRRRRRRAAV